MKKLAIVLTILSSFSLSAHAEPVKGAAYAEIRGIPGGWARIYKTAHSRYNRTANTISRIWTPKLYFFDKRGNCLAQENFAVLDESNKAAPDFNSPKYEKIMQGIQARLTVLPKVDHAGMVQCIKGAGRQWIELYDKKGLLIASLGRIENGMNFDEWVSVGDAIPQKAIDILKERVRNPELLYSLKIVETSRFPQLTGLSKLIFGK